MCVLLVCVFEGVYLFEDVDGFFQPIDELDECVLELVFGLLELPNPEFVLGFLALEPLNHPPLELELGLLALGLLALELLNHPPLELELGLLALLPRLLENQPPPLLPCELLPRELLPRELLPREPPLPSHFSMRTKRQHTNSANTRTPFISRSTVQQNRMLNILDYFQQYVQCARHLAMSAPYEPRIQYETF